MKKSVTQKLMKGTALCVHFSVCLLLVGALQTADGRIHRKPDFAKYASNVAPKPKHIMQKMNVALPWLEEKEAPKKEKIVAYIHQKGPLPWRAKSSKPVTKKTTDLVTYVAPKAKLASVSKPEPKQQAKNKKVSIKQVVAERERMRNTAKTDSELFGDETQIVSNEELSDIRGGFSAGGLVFDIGLFTQTIRDGVVIDELSLDVNDLFTQNQAVNLNRRIEITTEGVSVTNIPDVQQLMTTIQNSVSDIAISNTTTFNIDVQNAATFIQQSQLPLINHQLVRSLN